MINTKKPTSEKQLTPLPTYLHCFEVSQGSFIPSNAEVPFSQIQSQGWFQNSLQKGIEETYCRRYRRQNQLSWC